MTMSEMGVRSPVARPRDDSCEPALSSPLYLAPYRRRIALRSTPRPGKPSFPALLCRARLVPKSGGPAGR